MQPEATTATVVINKNNFINESICAPVLSSACQRELRNGVRTGLRNKKLELYFESTQLCFAGCTLPGGEASDGVESAARKYRFCGRRNF